MSVRNMFDKQLVVLNTQLVEMATLIESAITAATTALIERDTEQAQVAIAYEKEIDVREKKVESLCLKLLLQQQPVAKDLRQVSAALKMITDMERIGDQARDISEIFLNSKNNIQISANSDMQEMSKAAIIMVHKVVNAFVNTDLQVAKDVIAYDDVIDNLYQKTKDDLVEMIKKGGQDAEAAIDLLSIAKYFERIGDHATNIAEWVIYSITGEHTSN